MTFDPEQPRDDQGRWAGTGYHGSPETGLTVISAGTAGTQKYGNATSQLGAFFSPDAKSARYYSGDEGRVYQAQLDLANPYRMPQSEFEHYRSPEVGVSGEDLDPSEWSRREEVLKAEATARRAQLVAQGHDGILVINNRGAVVEIASFKDVRPTRTSFVTRRVKKL